MVRLIVIVVVSTLCAVDVAPASALDCTGVTGNLVPACGVANAGEAAIWASNGSGATLGFSAEGNPPGSLSADAGLGLSEWFAGAWTACFELSPSTEYTAGLEIRKESGDAAVTCDLGLQYFSDDACVTTLSASQLSSNVTVDGVTWTLLSGTAISDSSAGSARVSVACESIEDFVVLFDNAITRPGSTVPIELQAFAAE